MHVPFARPGERWHAGSWETLYARARTRTARGERGETCRDQQQWKALSRPNAQSPASSSAPFTFPPLFPAVQGRESPPGEPGLLLIRLQLFVLSQLSLLPFFTRSPSRLSPPPPRSISGGVSEQRGFEAQLKGLALHWDACSARKRLLSAEMRRLQTIRKFRASCTFNMWV
ncbi:unnamed protein product [Natator depressus]